MTNEQITKELSQFTKEEIIEALTRSIYNIQNLINECYKVQLEIETQALIKASAAWKKASIEQINYINQIKEEYKDVRVFDLPKEVRQKIIDLQKVVEQRFKEFVTIKDKLDNNYKKALKIR